MDDQNKSLNEQWGEPNRVPERGYAGDDAVERRTSEIRSEIEQTRGEMQETIDAIEDRLRPGNVMSRAAGSVRDATVGRVKQAAATAQESFSRTRRWSDGREGGGFTDRIRDNPVPAAIAAASLAWLAFSGRRREHKSPAIYGSTRQGEPYLRETTISTDMEEAGPRFDDDLESGRASIREHAGYMMERAHSLTDEAGSRVRSAAWQARRRTRRLTDDNALAVGAIAAAVGVAIGLALPETERENELMGEARDSVVGKAREAAKGAAERVQTAAEQVGKAAGEAASGIGDTRA